MPRVSRQLSPTGVYHVILRAVGRQIIFEDDSDRSFFVYLLRRYSSKQDIEIIAWVLMDNHVHLLINDPNQHLSDFMHRVASVYAMHFNSKTDHVGHVFENRYSRITIKDQNQLLNTVIYIHNNPVMALISDRQSYPWSSYKDYVGTTGFGITNTELVLGILGGIDGFVEISSRSGLKIVDKPNGIIKTDPLLIAYDELGEDLVPRIASLERGRRDEALRRLRKRGLSVRQIEFITGIGKSTIARVTKDESGPNEGRSQSQT